MEQTLGAYITAKRRELKKSRRQVAGEAGINHSYLGDIEKGTTVPSPDILRKLARPLHTPYRVLMVKAGYWNEALSEDELITEALGIDLDKWEALPEETQEYLLEDFRKKVDLFLKRKEEE